MTHPLEALAGEASLLLAISGGPDSTALLLMAAEWSSRPTLFASTVDHALRPESAEEALHVGRLCARLGIPHSILRWEGQKPKTRLSERARQVRYDLLTAEAHRVGARVIVTAHHADDQAETVLFRLARGSGLAGLAGMPARQIRGDIVIARPLLAYRKAELVAFCAVRNVDWVCDSSNENPRFARTRWRRLMPSLAQEGLDSVQLTRLARRASLAELALAEFTQQSGRALGWEAGCCEAQALATLPQEIVRRLLSNALPKAPLAAVERLAEDLLAAIAERRRLLRNVGNQLVSYDGKASVTLCPEPPRRGAHSFTCPNS